jgi:hypothetical protein
MYMHVYGSMLLLHPQLTSPGDAALLGGWESQVGASAMPADAAAAS